MANAWINHVKLFAFKHRLKYCDALKHPACKMSYHHSNKMKGGARKFTCASCGKKKLASKKILIPRKCLN